MSYNIKPKSGTKSGPITGNRVQNVESTLRLIKEISDEPGQFYELEPLEVLEVHLDDTKNSFPQGSDGPDYTYLGGVKGRLVISETGKNIDKLSDYKPLNPNIQTTPVIGEIVIGVKYLGQLFYTTQVNFFGNPNFNTQHGLSKGKSKDTLVSDNIDTANEQDDTGVKVGYYLEPTQDVRRLLPQEGDVLIEGRFGNTIRIGSDIKNDNQDSPNIILNAGQSKDDFPNPKQPVEEKIDTDGSSVYITTNQPLTFTPGIESKLSPPPYEGKNILLSSDRIIFNTKNGGDIVFGSNNNISICAPKEVVIEADTTKIGSVEASEPLVLGAILESKLNDILTLIETGLLAPTGPVVVGPGAGLLASLKSTLSQIKSPKNLVE
jgi:hypothetical protein